MQEASDYSLLQNFSYYSKENAEVIVYEIEDKIQTRLHNPIHFLERDNIPKLLRFLMQGL